MAAPVVTENVTLKIAESVTVDKPGLARDNQDETAATIRMRLGRG
jgi:hypothetical protein